MTSTNWSGYAVETSFSAPQANKISAVSASWKVPTVATTNAGYSSFWVGIDGYSSSTVQQIGTDSDYVNGVKQYYAWYEMYPNPFVRISTISVHPGDDIAASVTYTQTVGSTQHFTLSITATNATTGTSQTFATDQTSTTAQRSSAEWIAEAPSSISGVLPLANFGSVTFANAHATVDGADGTISAFANNSINMVTPKGALKASTSALNDTGDGFTVTFVSSGVVSHGRGKNSNNSNLQDDGSDATVLVSANLGTGANAAFFLTPQAGPILASPNSLTSPTAATGGTRPAWMSIGAYGDEVYEPASSPRMEAVPADAVQPPATTMSSYSPAASPGSGVFLEMQATQSSANRIVPVERIEAPAPASSPAAQTQETQDSTTGTATSALGKILGLVAAALFFTQGAFFGKPQGVVAEEKRERQPKR